MPAAGKGGARRPAKATKKAAKATKKPAKAGTKAVSRAKAAPARTKASATRAAKPAKPPGAARSTPAKATKTARSIARPAAKPAKAAKPAARQAKAAATATKAAPVKKGGKKTVVCELSGFEVTPSAPNLSPKTLERLKRRLLAERERLLRQSEELAAEAEQLAREREGGDTQFDEESGEGDTVNVERERDLLLSASARQDVEDIDEALVRMKRGTYGVCRYAGRRLPLERLELLPWADVCVDCKARAERRR